MVAGGGSEAGIYGRLPLLRLPLCELSAWYSLAVQETKWAQRRGLVVPVSVCQSGVPAHRVLHCVRLVSLVPGPAKHVCLRTSWRMLPIRLVRYPLRSNDLNLRRLKGFVKSDFEVFAFVGGSLASTKINGERERKFHVRQDVTSLCI